MAKYIKTKDQLINLNQVSIVIEEISPGTYPGIYRLVAVEGFDGQSGKMREYTIRDVRGPGMKDDLRKSLENIHKFIGRGDVMDFSDYDLDDLENIDLYEDEDNEDEPDEN